MSKHARLRLLERHGIALSDSEFEALLKSCAEAKDAPPTGYSCVVVTCQIADKGIRVIYDPEFERIVTVLGEDQRPKRKRSPSALERSRRRRKRRVR